jgi:hypothetical protein
MPRRRQWRDSDGWRGISAESEHLLFLVIKLGSPGAAGAQLGLEPYQLSQGLRAIRKTLNVQSVLHALLTYQRYRESQGVPIPFDIKPFNQGTPDENP